MMKFFVLPLGSCDCDKGLVFTPGKDEGVMVSIPIWAGLVQADGMNILIDTGMHPVHIENPAATFGGTPSENTIIPRMKAEDSVLFQLNKLGLQPEDIDCVVNTHLHFDHCGGNAFFPKATLLVGREHYQYALTRPGEFPPGYFLLPGLNYDFIDGEMTLLPGIDLIRCPGHVPGMMCVVLHLPQSGTIVVTSDAISLQELVDEDRWEAFWNPGQARTSAKRLAAIARSQSGRLFFGHDPLWWKTIRLAPEYYE